MGGRTVNGCRGGGALSMWMTVVASPRTLRNKVRNYIGIVDVVYGLSQICRFENHLCASELNV